jgi:plasmid maintenance system antidote protein VapI
MTASMWELLDFLMEQNDLTAEDIAKIIGADPSKVIAGEERFTPEQAKILGERFCTKPNLFLRPQHKKRDKK